MSDFSYKDMYQEREKMKKQVVKSIIAVVGVVALSLGMIPGGIAESAGIVTESRAAGEYEISAKLDVDSYNTDEEKVNYLIGLASSVGLPKLENGIPEEIKQAFQKAADAGKLGVYKDGKIPGAETFNRGQGAVYLIGYTIDQGPDYKEYKYFALVHRENASEPEAWQDGPLVISIDYNIDGTYTYSYDYNSVSLQADPEYYLFTINNGTSTSSTSSDIPTHAYEHQHTYEWKILTDPTIDKDGIYAYICSCGDIKEKQPISAAQVFVKGLYGKVKDAPQNSTVTYDAKSWSTISDYLLKKMAEREDVTVTIQFQYQRNNYEITFPAGTDYTEVLNDTENMYGFFGIAKILGLEVKAL